MFPLVELPAIVQHYAPHFEAVFSAEAWLQFQRYVSGLLVSENKTVDGINRLFVLDRRNQSSLNRLLTESPFTPAGVHEARLRLLQSLPGTRMKRQGVLSIDDTLLTHYGQDFEKIALLYDSKQDCYVWAHNLVNLHYSDEMTDYPVACRLWEPADLEVLEAGLRAAGLLKRPQKFQLKDTDPKRWRRYLLGVFRRHQKKPEVADLYQSKLILAQQLLTEFCRLHPDGDWPVVFDNWYTQPAFCRYLDQTLKRAYVGTLEESDPVQLARGKQTLKAFDEQLRQEHQEALAHGQPPVFQKIGIRYKGTKETYYSYCRSHRIPNFGKQRLVINHSQADLSDSAQFFICNRLNWQAAGITRCRRHRWPVEVYHEEGKAEGLDQYQVRDFEAIDKHIALVAVTYSLLRAAPHDPALLHKLSHCLEKKLEGSAAAGRRACQAQALWTLGLFIAAGLQQGQSFPQVMQPLLAAYA